MKQLGRLKNTGGYARIYFFNIRENCYYCFFNIFSIKYIYANTQ